MTFHKDTPDFGVDESIVLILVLFLCVDLAAPSNDKCQLAICRCDSDAVKCFARNKIDPQYENYPQSKCN